MDIQFTEKIFQKFSQEDESVTRKHGGTGLGMSITRELVELMNGKIFVESEKNNGTKIYFDIEFEIGTESAIAHKTSTPQDVSILQNKVILVADDNKMNRVVAGAILKNYPRTIIYAENGLEAVEKTISHQPDIILMDVQMPRLDGLQATKHIRDNISKTIPIIALTALAIKGDKEKCKKAGMNEYLSKPFDENDLIEKLCTCLTQVNINDKEMITQREKQNTKLFSLEKLNTLAQGDEAFIAEMTHIFIEQAQLSIEQINKAAKNGDIATIKKVAHRLKPSIDNLQIHSIIPLVRELEKDADTLHSNNKLRSKIEFLETTLNLVMSQLIESHIQH